MRAELKRLHSPDVPDLAGYSPLDPECFGVLIQAMVGPEGEDAEESFDIIVCSPRWIEARLGTSPMVGRHRLVLAAYDYPLIWRFLVEYCRKCEASTWPGVANLVGRIGRWEFEDYCERQDSGTGLP